MVIKGFWGEGVIFFSGELVFVLVNNQLCLGQKLIRFSGGYIERRDESRRVLDGGGGQERGDEERGGGGEKVLLYDGQGLEKGKEKK